MQAAGVALMACSACEKLMHRLCSNSTASAAGTRICTACSEAAKSHVLCRSHRSRMMSDKAAAASAFTVPDPNPLPAAGDADETNSSSVNITSRSCLQKARAVVALVMDNCGGHTVKEPGFRCACAAAQPELHIRSPTPGRGHHFSLYCSRGIGSG